MHSATRYPTIKAGDVWAVTIAQALHASDDETAWLYLAHHGGRRPRQHDIVSFGRSDVKNVELSPDDVAACAVEIIRGLSAGDDHDRWEFNFSRHGLRVSVKKGRAQRPAMRPQEDFDFGQMPATIQ
jgi:hypothetical protein